LGLPRGGGLYDRGKGKSTQVCSGLGAKRGFFHLGFNRKPEGGRASGGTPRGKWGRKKRADQQKVENLQCLGKKREKRKSKRGHGGRKNVKGGSSQIYQCSRGRWLGGKKGGVKKRGKKKKKKFKKHGGGAKRWDGGFGRGSTASQGNEKEKIWGKVVTTCREENQLQKPLRSDGRKQKCLQGGGIGGEKSRKEKRQKGKEMDWGGRKQMKTTIQLLKGIPGKGNIEKSEGDWTFLIRGKKEEVVGGKGDGARGSEALALSKIKKKKTGGVKIRFGEGATKC